MKQEKLKEVSKQIQEILESNKMALQPHINFSPSGITPAVALVSTEKNEQEGDSGEAGEDSGESGAADAK